MGVALNGRVKRGGDYLGLDSLRGRWYCLVIKRGLRDGTLNHILPVVFMVT